jgi:hypothetical protein
MAEFGVKGKPTGRHGWKVADVLLGPTASPRPIAMAAFAVESGVGSDRGWTSYLALAALGSPP